MKKLLLIVAVFTVFLSCKKDDDPTLEPQISEIDKLPPATQIGKNTIGCLVNGKAFLPSGKAPNSNNTYFGYYHDNLALVFSIFRHENHTTMLGSETIALYNSDTILEEGNTYLLKASKSNHSAIYTHVTDLVYSDDYETTNDYIGELHITKLDKEKFFMSGTFWFDAVNEKGKKVEIREGRFDMHFEGWAGKNSN